MIDAIMFLGRPDHRHAALRPGHRLSVAGADRPGPGYVFAALILIPHALTFPGAFAPDGLLGAGVSTTAWLYIFWRAALPIAVILYVLLQAARMSPAPPATERPAARIAVGVFAAIAWRRR